MPLIIILLIFLPYEILHSMDEYFLTLRNDKVNLRQGPSFDYPVKIYYEKKFLPVLVQEKADKFRKIRDHENNTGWIHVSQLSKKKAAIIVDEEQMMFSDPTIYSKPIAKLEIGRLVNISKCEDTWCKIKTNKFKGWIKKASLWGLL